MALRHVVSLVALLGLAGCSYEREKEGLSSPESSSIEDLDTPQESPQNLLKPLPPCIHKVPSSELETALRTLETDAGRAYVVSGVMKQSASQAWIRAAGGPALDGCIGENSPIQKERLVKTITHYRATHQWYAALKLTEQAGTITEDLTTFGNSREIALEAARNTGVSLEGRAYFYGRASDFGPHSYTSNLELARAIVDYNVSHRIGTSSTNSVIHHLLPDSLKYTHDDGRVEDLVIPNTIKVEKEKLLTKVKRIDNVGSATLTPDDLSPPPGNPCRLFVAVTKEGNWESLFAIQNSEKQCNYPLIMAAYEEIGEYGKAGDIARAHNLPFKGMEYAVMVRAMSEQ